MWSYVHCFWPWFGPFSLRHLFTLIEKQTAQIDQLAELVVRHLEGGEVGMRIGPGVNICTKICYSSRT